MNKFYYGNPNKTGTWAQAACVFAAHESVNSPRTSSLPLVQFWKPDSNRKDGLSEKAKHFLSICGLKDEELSSLDAYFEYPVAVRQGVGKASMTDLMLISNSHVIAIEAKWTECRRVNYPPSVMCWIDSSKNNDNKNRKKVRDGWLEYINERIHGGKKITADDVGDMPYQLLHRIASACAVADKKKPVVAYHLFFSDSDKQIKTDVFARNLLGCGLIKRLEGVVDFHVIKTRIEGGQFLAEETRRCCGKKERYNELFLRMQMDDENAVYRFSKPEEFDGCID